eukprot:1782674-Pleurochrysis_carterae.AAC.1
MSGMMKEELQVRLTRAGASHLFNMCEFRIFDINHGSRNSWQEKSLLMQDIDPPKRYNAN